jgi:radical SAM superfamily enzyme YgiQ (UPF0313 family)
MNVLLVSPGTPPSFWSFKHVLPLISRKAAFPPLGLLTAAAMLPREWNLKLVDLDVSRLHNADIDWADYVFISAMIVQADSSREVIHRCIARGTPVIAGGPLFTTGRDRFPELKHCVMGEAENIMPEVIEDMRSGNLKPVYRDPGKPDLTTTPIPRWDLVDFKHYANMSVQFSRGCPFNCEFCDIIVMYGRRPRVKTPEQVVCELDYLVDLGWRDSVFIVDDNFIGHKPKAKELLRHMTAWRKRRRVKISFSTEASLNVVDDPELLDLMVQAGFKQLFVGIETIQEESLVECAKVQNTQRDLLEAVKKIQNAGIEVMGGFIVGFDNDDAGIFERMSDFIQESGVVAAMVGLLTALPETQLYARLEREGRILQETTGNNLDAILNFVPKLDRDFLQDGYRSLVQGLYAPKAYYQRSLKFLREYFPNGQKRRYSRAEVVAFLKSLWVIGVWTRGRREYWKYFMKSLLFHRHAFSEAMRLAILGFHFRKIAATV